MVVVLVVALKVFPALIFLPNECIASMVFFMRLSLMVYRSLAELSPAIPPSELSELYRSISLSFWVWALGCMTFSLLANDSVLINGVIFFAFLGLVFNSS